MTSNDKKLIAKAIEARDKYEAADYYSRDCARLGRLFKRAMAKLTPYYRDYVSHAYDLMYQITPAERSLLDKAIRARDDQREDYADILRGLCYYYQTYVSGKYDHVARAMAQ